MKQQVHFAEPPVSILEGLKPLRGFHGTVFDNQIMGSIHLDT